MNTACSVGQIYAKAASYNTETVGYGLKILLLPVSTHP